MRTDNTSERRPPWRPSPLPISWSRIAVAMMLKAACVKDLVADRQRTIVGDVLLSPHPVPPGRPRVEIPRFEDFWGTASVPLDPGEALFPLACEPDRVGIRRVPNR